jgi:hypothetical protein
MKVWAETGLIGYQFEQIRGDLTGFQRTESKAARWAVPNNRTEQIDQVLPWLEIQAPLAQMDACEYDLLITTVQESRHLA